VAIDRATRLGIRADLPQQDGGQRAPVASRDLDRACPVKITRVLTDNVLVFAT